MPLRVLRFFHWTNCPKLTHSTLHGSILNKCPISLGKTSRQLNEFVGKPEKLTIDFPARICCGCWLIHEPWLYEKVYELKLNRRRPWTWQFDFDFHSRRSFMSSHAWKTNFWVRMQEFIVYLIFLLFQN